MPIQKLSPNFEAAVGVEANNYQYNGIELVEDFGLHTNHAQFRSLDPQINLWGQIDPLAEKYYAWSGYNYVLGNPVRLVDMFGMTPNYYYSGQGDYLGEDDAPTDEIRIMEPLVFNDIQELSGLENGVIPSDLGLSNSRSINQALKSGQLSLEGYSNMLTKEISLMPEVDPTRLLNGKVSVIDMSVLYDGDFEMPVFKSCNNIYEQGGGIKSLPFNNGAEEAYSLTLSNGDIALVAQLEFGSTQLLTTRSDIQSLMGIHEFLAHQILGLENKDHPSIYQYVVKQHPTWQSVSPAMKKNYLKLYYKF